MYPLAAMVSKVEAAAVCFALSAWMRPPKANTELVGLGHHPPSCLEKRSGAKPKESLQPTNGCQLNHTKAANMRQEVFDKMINKWSTNCAIVHCRSHHHGQFGFVGHLHLFVNMFKCLWVCYAWITHQAWVPVAPHGLRVKQIQCPKPQIGA